MKGIITIALLFLIVGCKNETINSQIATTDISIDGKLLEWGVLHSPSNETIGIGVMHDDANLYVALSTYDESIKANLIHGMTLWINDEGKKKEKFGIKYPLQMDIMYMPNAVNEPKSDRKSRNRGRDSETMIDQILLQQEDLILTDNGFERYIPIDNGEGGIQIKMDHSKENLIYELKIPLSMLNISKEKIALGIKSEEIERPDMAAQRGGSLGGGGGKQGGGRQGGGPGGGGGMQGGGRSNMNSESSSQLKIWIKVLLATE